MSATREGGLRVLVSGMLAGEPGQGGASWAVLQYLLGLRRLGHRPVLVEPVQPEAAPVADYFGDICIGFGIDEAALLLTGTRKTIGLTYRRLLALSHEADVLLNVSGMLTDEALLDRVPVRAFLDLDPAFNQLWHLQGTDMGFARHTHFVTVGLALGGRGCDVPTLGLPWITTLPPVVLEQWPMAEGPPRRGFTTVGHWRSYGRVEHRGVRYGLKAHSLRALLALPAATGTAFELALAIHPAERDDLRALDEHGWQLVDPAVVAATPARYQAFIAESLAELGIAKQGYVVSRSGWFSDRSACYLAAGRPVLAQETGFSRYLPTGEGLLVFTTLEEAAEGVRRILADPARHRRNARRLAEEHLDADRVLAGLIDRLAVAA
jgi:hypothetical protein